MDMAGEVLKYLQSETPLPFVAKEYHYCISQSRSDEQDSLVFSLIYVSLINLSILYCIVTLICVECKLYLLSIAY